MCACKHRHKAKNAWRRQSRWILEKNEWAIKKSQRQRTLGELFFFLVDERADIIFSRSLGIQRADPFNMPFFRYLKANYSVQKTKIE